MNRIKASYSMLFHDIFDLTEAHECKHLQVGFNHLIRYVYKKLIELERTKQRKIRF